MAAGRKSGEIDILETVNLGAPCAETCAGGRENRVFGTIHFAGDPSGAHKQVSANTPIPGAVDGFHVYAVEWSAEAIVWFVDGRQYAQAKAADWKGVDQNGGAAPFDQPFHLILNLAFGGRWPEGANAKGDRRGRSARDDGGRLGAGQPTTIGPWKVGR
jgi:beta-glucanase (GH16 family)